MTTAVVRLFLAPSSFVVTKNQPFHHHTPHTLFARAPHHALAMNRIINADRKIIAGITLPRTWRSPDAALIACSAPHHIARARCYSVRRTRSKQAHEPCSKSYN